MKASHAKLVLDWLFDKKKMLGKECGGTFSKYHFI